MKSINLINQIFSVFFDAFTTNISWLPDKSKEIYPYIKPNNYEELLLREFLDEKIKAYSPVIFMSTKVNEQDLKGTIIVGPFLHEQITQDGVKKLLIHEGSSPSKLNERLAFYTSLPVIHPSKSRSINLLLSALIKHPIETNQEVSSSYEPLINPIEFHHDQWKQSINPYYMGKIEAFYEALFSATHDEVYQVLSSYYFITQPFELAITDEKENIKQLGFVMLGMTVSFAILHQLPMIEILEQSRLTYDKLSYAKTDQEVVTLRNQMFIAFNNISQQKPKKSYSLPVNKILQYIDDNIFEPIELSEIAAIDNYEKNYVSILFKKETGKTILQYVKEKKIDIAKSILMSSNSSIHDICDYLSFSSYQQFVRTFKRYVGQTPSKYRSTLTKKRSI